MTQTEEDRGTEEKGDVKIEAQIEMLPKPVQDKQEDTSRFSPRVSSWHARLLMISLGLLP